MAIVCVRVKSLIGQRNFGRVGADVTCSSSFCCTRAGRAIRVMSHDSDQHWQAPGCLPSYPGPAIVHQFKPTQCTWRCCQHARDKGERASPAWALPCHKGAWAGVLTLGGGVRGRMLVGNWAQWCSRAFVLQLERMEGGPRVSRRQPHAQRWRWMM